MSYYFIVINIISFILFGIDKKRSIKKKYRISEFTLILISLIGGCFGSMLGMFYYHHKNKKIKFLISLPLISIVWILIFINI